MTDLSSVEDQIDLIGILLNYQKGIFDVMDLSPLYFEDEFLREVFIEICKQASDGKSPNMFTMQHIYAGDDEKKNIMSNLQATVYTTKAPIGVLKERIKDTASRKKALELISELQEQLVNPQTDVEDMAAHALQGFEAIMTNSAGNKFETASVVGQRIATGLKHDRKAYSTGISKLDEAMGGGLHSGFTYGWCAKKKFGKTVMASTISYNLAQNGTKHVFICGEMGPDQIHERVMSRHLNVYPSTFRGQARLNPEFQTRVAEAAFTIEDNLIYRNAPGLTFQELRQIFVEAVYTHKVKGIILDYWQLVGGKEKGKSTAEHLDRVAQWIADFGRKHDIFCFVVGQINQDGNTRGSEGLRLACDQCYKMHREVLERGEIWVEMMDTRYTKWINLGSEDNPSLFMNEKGPFIQEIKEMEPANTYQRY